VTVRGALVAVTALLALTSACGGDSGGGSASSGDDPVAAAQRRLAAVHRATIDLSFTADTGTADKPGDPVGFRLAGPFQLPGGDGDLPVAELRNTRLLGDHQVASTFVSTGTRAFVVPEGSAPVELKGEQLDALRGSNGAGAANLEALHLSKWFATRKVTTANGTTTVRGDLDAPAAITDVLALSDGTSGSTKPPTLAGKDADQLRSLVRSSSIELTVDSDDRTPQHLHFDVRFAPEDRPKVAAILPDLAGVGLTFDLRLTDVGRAVEVTVPRR
jgi:hypothetical protein